MKDGKVLYGILGTTPAIQTLVGQRIYPIVAPQGATQPFITFETLQRRPTDTKQNVSKYDIYQIQIGIVSNDYTNACDITDKVRTAIDQYRGVVNGVDVDKIVYESGTANFDESASLFVIAEVYTLKIHR